MLFNIVLNNLFDSLIYNPIMYSPISFIFFLFPILVISALGQVVINDFRLQDPELEVTLWAESPLLYNPTNMDVDTFGRIWVTEGVNYRRSNTRKEGDRVVVLEDTNLDGIADKSTVFIQDPELVEKTIKENVDKVKVLNK